MCSGVSGGKAEPGDPSEDVGSPQQLAPPFPPRPPSHLLLQVTFVNTFCVVLITSAHLVGRRDPGVRGGLVYWQPSCLKRPEAEETLQGTFDESVSENYGGRGWASFLASLGG